LPQGDVREEVINVALAELLSDRGLVTTPEPIRLASGGVRLPDVVVNHFQGLRMIIEGKIQRGTAEREVLDQANERVEQGRAHIGIAAIYDPSVAGAGGYAKVMEMLSTSTLKLAVCTENGIGEWTEGNVDHPGRLLEHRVRALPLPREEPLPGVFRPLR
jgi:hypothetical protein